MIGLCLDSNSQISRELVERYDVEVVPMRVMIDGREFREGVDLSVDEFYAHWDDGSTPDVSTSQPPPTDFVVAYRRLIERGATEILSIHIAESMSGTLNSARLAAEMVDEPVRLVDTGTASFGISCCAWSAGEAIRAGADLAEAALRAERTARELGTAFIVGVPALVDRSGRSTVDVGAASAAGIPVLATSGGELGVIDTVTDVEDAVAAMAAYATSWPISGARRRRVAVGTSDLGTEELGDRLAARVAGDDVDLVRYLVGPSVGAHLGPGTAGLFVF